MRVMYGIALVSGVIVMNVHGILTLAIIHKASASLFIISLVALLIHKILKNK